MAATQPAKLGNIEFDAIIERDETMSSDVPEYATEVGYSVADNVCLKPVDGGRQTRPAFCRNFAWGGRKRILLLTAA